MRTHIPRFHIPDFSKERYDGDPLTAHLAIKYLRDLIDADHCAYIFDKNHDLEDLGYLEDLHVRDVARRRKEILAFNATHQKWESDLEALLNAWLDQGRPIEAMAEGDAKTTAIQAHWDLKQELLQANPEPTQPKFEPQLLATEATLLAARETEDKKRKNDADKCMGRFKA